MTYKLTKEDYRILHEQSWVSVRENEAGINIPAYVRGFSQGEGENGVYANLSLVNIDDPEGEMSLLRLPVNDETIDWNYPELGMVESIKGVATSFIKRSDKKQYRRSLLLDNINVLRVSRKEMRLLGYRRLCELPIPSLTQKELIRVFNKRYYSIDVALSRVRSGESLSLPISKDLCILQKAETDSPILNRCGFDIAKIDKDNRVLLPKSLKQMREQIEGVGLAVMEV